jgi:hypothetical protein
MSSISGAWAPNCSHRTEDVSLISFPDIAFTMLATIIRTWLVRYARNSNDVDRQWFKRRDEHFEANPVMYDRVIFLTINARFLTVH